MVNVARFCNWGEPVTVCISKASHVTPSLPHRVTKTLYMMGLLSCNRYKLISELPIALPLQHLLKLGESHGLEVVSPGPVGVVEVVADSVEVSTVASSSLTLSSCSNFWPELNLPRSSHPGCSLTVDIQNNSLIIKGFLLRKDFRFRVELISGLAETTDHSSAGQSTLSGAENNNSKRTIMFAAGEKLSSPEEIPFLKTSTMDSPVVLSHIVLKETMTEEVIPLVEEEKCRLSYKAESNPFKKPTVKSTELLEPSNDVETDDDGDDDANSTIPCYKEITVMCFCTSPGRLEVQLNNSFDYLCVLTTEIVTVSTPRGAHFSIEPHTKQVK